MIIQANLYIDGRFWTSMQIPRIMHFIKVSVWLYDNVINSVIFVFKRGQQTASGPRIQIHYELARIEASPVTETDVKGLTKSKFL